MDTYFTLEEKYIQATEEMNYGEPAKALKLFNELLDIEPDYARTYFQLGKIYYYYIQDYQSAGYYFSRCTELEPKFPDVYIPYIQLLVSLNMTNRAKQVTAYALNVPGINAGTIYEQLGLLAEKNLRLEESLENYNKGLLMSICKDETESIGDAIKRVKNKILTKGKYAYHIS
jgi:tetratricopeptide (TPR) repeat protein